MAPPRCLLALLLTLLGFALPSSAPLAAQPLLYDAEHGSQSPALEASLGASLPLLAPAGPLSLSPLSPLVGAPTHGRSLYASNVTIQGDAVLVTPLLLWPRLYLELQLSYSGDLVAPPGYAGSPVPVWLENPAAQPSNQVQCYGFPRSALPSGAVAQPAALSLQTGLLAGVLPPAPSSFLPSSVLAIAQTLSLTSSLTSTLGSMRVYGTYPFDGSGGMATQLQAVGLSVPFTNAAYATSPGSPRVRLLMELYANGVPAPYQPVVQPRAAADAQGSLASTLVAALAQLTVPATLISSASGPTLLYQYIEEVPDLSVPIHGASGAPAAAAGSDAASYRALFPLWPGLPLAPAAGTPASLGYVWVGATMLQLGLQYTLVVSVTDPNGNVVDPASTQYATVASTPGAPGRGITPFTTTSPDADTAAAVQTTYGYSSGMATLDKASGAWGVGNSYTFLAAGVHSCMVTIPIRASVSASPSSRPTPSYTVTVSASSAPSGSLRGSSSSSPTVCGTASGGGAGALGA